MIGSGKKEGWPECFQDLGGWCPLPQDELHTPKVTFQDEFNFSNDDGHANDWDLVSSRVDLQCDPWGNDTQIGISSCQPLIGEINNSLIQERTPLGVISNKTPNLLASGGKLLYTITTDGRSSPLKSKGNVLLSQGIVKSESSDDSTFLNMAATLDQETNNPTNCYLLPIVPEFASAKLNSSSLSTTYLTSSLQSLSPISPPTPPPPTPPPPTTIKKSSLTASGAALPKRSNVDNIQRVKVEEQGVNDSFKVPAISSDGGREIEKKFVPIGNRIKPQLKLNIAAAANNSNNNSNKFSPTLNTPEVFRLVDGGDSKEFNLLQYVCNDGEYSGLSQEEDERNVELSIRDHDYTDSWPFVDVNSDVVIKDEPGSPASISCSISNKSTTKDRPKRRSQRDDSSDYIASDSDEIISDSDDSQQEWSPSPPKKRMKRKTSINSSKTTSSNKNAGIGGKRAARRTSSNSQIIREDSSVNLRGQDKYRELRERNNEASRRSRMNRKQKDEEMLQMAEDLHKRNVYLKARSEKMENLVKYMRAEIMKALSKPK